MSAKVSSTRLYGELRAILGEEMEHAGFAPLKGGRLGWQRRGPKGWTSLWFQCDKWGWTEDWGSTFTLEFQLTEGPEGAMTLKGRSERIGYLLEGFPELDELRVRNNAVIARLPGSLANKALVTTFEDGSEAVLLGHRVDPEKAVYGRDIWMNYYAIDDARVWARYFEHKLPGFVDLFEQGRRSAQGLARERFNAMMGRVQAEAALAAKIGILQDYVAAEPDAHFRTDAEHWLAQARAKEAGQGYRL